MVRSRITGGAAAAVLAFVPQFHGAPQLTAGHAAAQAKARPVVLELFTSEGCSSCPPADALLRQLAQSRVDVLPLAFHVTYWNNLGWRDPYSLEVATARQRNYAGSLPSDVYTPQLVVDGRIDVIGSDRSSVDAAIRQSQAASADDVTVSVHRDHDEGVVEIAGAPSGASAARVIVIGYDFEHVTQVGRGENAGRSLVEANIVRAVAPVGEWRGGDARWRIAVPAGDHLAVLVQSATGAIIGAAREAAHAS